MQVTTFTALVIIALQYIDSGHFWTRKQVVGAAMNAFRALRDGTWHEFYVNAGGSKLTYHSGKFWIRDYTNDGRYERAIVLRAVDYITEHERPVFKTL